jgi:hypothetical protein
MRKVRLNCYFTRTLADRLAAEAARQGVHLSQLIEAAAASHLDPNALARRKDARDRRLDRLSEQLAELADEIRVVFEAQATFVQLWLRLTPQLPDSAEPAARARGAKRFDTYVEDVTSALRQGGVFQRALAAAKWSHDITSKGAAHEEKHVAAP